MKNIQLDIILQFFTILVFIALIVALPSVQFMPKSIIWFNDRQRLLELLLITLTLLDSILIIKQQLWIDKTVSLGLTSTLGLSIISAVLAESPRHAVIEISVFAALCYFALLIATLYNQNKIHFIRWLTYVIWLSISLYMVSFYSGYTTAAIFKTPVIWPQPFNGFSNIRSFNQYQLWSLGIIALPLLAFELKKNVQRCLYIALALWWVLLFYSASRGVLLAWFSGMLITAMVYKNIAHPFLKLQLISALTGYCAYYVLFTIMPALLHINIVTGTVIRDTANDRIALWHQAFILIQENPIFGVGPMHYAWHNLTNGHPHNSILQLGSEWGLPATVIILILAGYGFYSWFKVFNSSQLENKPKSDYTLAIVLFFTIITNALYSLVDGVIVSPISQVLMFTFIGLMIGQSRVENPTKTQDTSRLRPIIAGITLVALLWSTLPEIANGLFGKDKGFSMGYTAEGPRFWREVK